jgi:hypothetical protein
MYRNVAKSLLLSISLILSISVGAAECRWKAMLGDELMHFDSDQSTNKKLSKNEVQEDLECLKIIFNNYYVGQETFKDISFISRIEEKIIFADKSTSLELLDNLFQLHNGAKDLHVGYHIWSTGEMRTFFKAEESLVTINKDFKSEKIVKQANYTYFKPGDLRDQLSDGQSKFVDFVINNDKNLIIDMRNNPGGDDVFVEKLVEALFTPSQDIPKSYTYEVDSLFKSIGMCISLYSHDYYGAQEYCNFTRKTVTDVPFEDLIRFKIHKTVKELFGQRTSNYQSKIAILIDSGCASACETTVEKLSIHPNVTTYGQNTAGALHFANATTVMLPNSGIITKIPTLLHQYDNDAPEGIGYSPDIEKKHIDLDLLFQ